MASINTSKINYLKTKRIVFCLLFPFLFTSCFGGENKKEMRASEILKLINKEKPVLLQDKIILDDLDFSGIKNEAVSSVSSIQKRVDSNILFVNCVFMKEVTASGVQKKMQKKVLFERNVNFVGCDFRGEVNFENVTFKGEIDFSRSTFREKVSFNEIVMFGKRNVFSGIVAEANFQMINALIHGSLDFMDAKFQSDTYFQSLIVSGLQFSNTVFEKGVDFSNTIAYENTFFNYVTYNENAIFAFSKFFGDVDFRHNSFNQNADFSDTFFYGETRFNNSSFKKEVNFLNTIFIQTPQTKDVILEDELKIQVVESKQVNFK